MVPEGWARVEIGDAGRVVTGSTPPTVNRDYYDGDVPFVSPADLKGQRFVRIAGKTLTEAGLQVCRSIPIGASLFVCIGSTIGKVGQADRELATNQQINAVIPGPETDPDFLFYELLNRSKHIARLAGNQAVPLINKSQFSAETINLPPLPEQRKIAEILSTWDRAIETTEALLANARTQKRALMQSLLTGKRRFPEFEGQEWREVRLGEVAKIIMSNVDKKSVPDEQPVRLCNYTDVYQRDTIDPSQPFMEATATSAQIEKFGLWNGDVIITKDSETSDDIAMPTFVAGSAPDLVCGYHLAIIRPGKEAEGRFLKFYFELPHTRHYFGTRANGAIRFGLTVDGIEGAVFQIPGVDEQHRIAKVISNAEIEITRHGKTVEKLRTEKKALMQQLLTGKKRVVI